MYRAISFHRLLLVCLVLCACRAEGPPDLGGTKEDPIARLVVGFDPQGAVVVFDAFTGEEKSRAEGGGGKPRDVSVDAAGEVWIFEENEEASGGEIRKCFWSGEAIGSCGHLVWVDGAAAMLATDGGLWVFEDGPAGPRWKVFREGEAFRGAFAPRPRAVREEAGLIEALTYGASGDHLEVWRAAPRKDASPLMERFDLDAPLGFPATARLSFGVEENLLWDVTAGALLARRVKEQHVMAPIGLGVEASRIEAVAAIDGGFVVLTPAEAWIVRGVDRPDEPFAVSTFKLSLPGCVSEASLFFSRDLLSLGDRALVATDRGVFSIDVENVTRDESFAGDALRGPLGLVLPGR